MAECLHPRWIKIDRRKSNRLPYTSWWFKRYVRLIPDLMDYVPCPCGKCINCLRNKQNAMVSRCLAESEKRGTFSFVTLTYSDENLPIAQSLWRVSEDTGVIELCSPGEIVSTHEDSLFLDRAKVLSLAASEEPRYYDKEIDGFFDGEYHYFSRLTPSLNSRDPRLWIKRCRVSYEREFNTKLDFTYVIVGEMGPRTCRPHYHLALFGLTKEQVQYFVDRWKLGYTCVKHVNKFNPDGTDGFAIASRYIGKYMSKGKFDCMSVLDKSALKPRVCQSKGIGKSLIDYVRSQVCCFDLFGEYDLDTLVCPTLGRRLSVSELDTIVKQIPKRLSYETAYGFHLPVPRLFREEIFYHKSIKYERKKRVQSDGICRTVKVAKVLRVPTAIWSMVTAYLREHISTDNQRKFVEYLRRYGEGQIDIACYAFDAYAESRNEISERSRETDYINFLNSSKDCQ